MTIDHRPTIGLNLTWLVPGVVGGSEEYTIRLLTGVLRIAGGSMHFRAYGRRDLFDRYPELADAATPVVMPGDDVSRLRRVGMEQTWLARAAAGDAAVHHLGGTIPLRPRRRPVQKVAVTIHDLQPVEMAWNFSPVKRAWLGRAIPFAVHNADVIVCPSRFTADRIVARYGVDDSRVKVVRQGYHVAGDRAGGDPVNGSTPSAGLVERFGSRRFVLYPAIAYAHKRHRDLIAALAALPPRLADLDLVFCGRQGPETPRLNEQARRTGVGHRVHQLGRVPETDLNWLYANALALVFPSEYEGFGNPCLEAMARGCPVLASRTAALPEVVEDAGLLIPPGDVNAWARAITELADDPRRAADLATRGRVRAAAFDPAIASDRLWSVYRDLLGPDPVESPIRAT